MSGVVPFTELPQADHLTTEQVDSARRYVAGQSVDADDCRLLLDALGLNPKGTP